MPLNLGQAVERYRTLGLAIEAAVAMDRWDEVDVLLNERDIILKQFADGTPRIDSQSKTQLQACDQRLLQFLTGTRASAVAGLRSLKEGTQARSVYRTQGSSGATFDRAG